MPPMQLCHSLETPASAAQDETALVLEQQSDGTSHQICRMLEHTSRFVAM